MVTDTGTLNPEQMLQQQQILRQQKMAEMLMQQGAQQPQGQMVSGRYVAPSIFQNLGNLANQFVGQRGIEKAQQAQIDLAKAIRQGDIAATADFMKTKQGRPAVEGGLYGPDGKLTMQTTADMIGPQGEILPSYRNVAPVSAIAPNPQGAYANLMANPKASPRLQSKAWAIAGAMAGSFISGLASAQQTQSVSAFGFTQAQPTGRNALLQGVAQTAADQSRRFVEDSTAEKPVLVVEPGAEVSVLIQEEVRF